MGFIEVLVQAIIDWSRDLLLNLSGRCAEEFVGRRIKRRRRKKRSQERKVRPKSPT
jgi:hypothetical protein